MIENINKPELIDLSEDWSIVSCEPKIIVLVIVRELFNFYVSKIQLCTYTPNLVYRYRKPFRKQASRTACLALLSRPDRSSVHAQNFKWTK